MKTLLVLLFTFSFSFLTVAGSDLEKKFVEGNSFYSKGEYSQALSVYKGIERSGLHSAELYFNIGNAYFQLDSLAPAILYFERAKKLNPTDEDILFNLDIANQKTVDRIDKLPVLFIKDWWQRFTSFLSLEGWSFLTIVFCWITFLSAAIFIISKTRIFRISFFTIGSITLLGTIVLLVISVSVNNRMNNEKDGIIFSPTITIKSAPASGKDLFVLHEGTKVKILDKADGWVKIRIGNGNVGWLPERSIQGI